jgi:hypothetical protein
MPNIHPSGGPSRFYNAAMYGIALVALATAWVAGFVLSMPTTPGGLLLLVAVASAGCAEASTIAGYYGPRSERGRVTHERIPIFWLVTVAVLGGYLVFWIVRFFLPAFFLISAEQQQQAIVTASASLLLSAGILGVARWGSRGRGITGIVSCNRIMSVLVLVHALWYVLLANTQSVFLFLVGGAALVVLAWLTLAAGGRSGTWGHLVLSWPVAEEQHREPSK